MNYENILCRRVAEVPPSGIRKFFDIVNVMEDVISLGVGEPDFRTPWNYTDAAIYSLRSGHTHYTSNWGLIELRREIARYQAERFGPEYNPENEILITVGASEGIDLAVRALVEPGDEVLVPDPSYVSYMPCITFAGGVCVPIPTYMADGFKLTPEALRAAITPRTKALILPYLEETLEELKTRKPDKKNPFRARVAIVGSEIDDHNLTKLIENCGALVVSDRYCFGSAPGREVIELKEDEDALRQICLHYMQVSECARYIADEKVLQRRETADRLAKEFKAEGIIYEQMKYCDYWGFERALVSHIMAEEYGWPVLSIDRLYNNGNSGQLRTRVQAFVESLEIKRIHKEGK